MTLDLHIRIATFEPLAAAVSWTRSPDRLVSWLSAGFGIVALLLTSVSLYGARLARRVGGRLRLAWRGLRSSLCPAVTLFLHSRAVVFPAPLSASFQGERQSGARLSHVECRRAVPD
jgi:hypothetical protein